MAKKMEPDYMREITCGQLYRDTCHGPVVSTRPDQVEVTKPEMIKLKGHHGEEK